MALRSTHTVVTLEISVAAFNEIREKLEAAGYQHAIFADASHGSLMIDMTGIGLTPPPVQIDMTKPSAVRTTLDEIDCSCGASFYPAASAPRFDSDKIEAACPNCARKYELAVPGGTWKPTAD